MKPVNVKPSAYIDSSQEIHDEDPEFKIGDLKGEDNVGNFYEKEL